MTELSWLRKEIGRLKERNARVEADKAWETSWARKLVIFILTYLAMAIYFYATGLPNPLVNSFVPALAFVISTLSLPLFKKYWAENFYKK
ncbi:MAG TPA: hypothetical protein VI875_03515 [Candidatus Norongarragalinales archaeon]|nr:hypothetical protein [Candidatus Norongarragalinales archaeon]